jgi:hypothetical protein
MLLAFFMIFEAERLASPAANRTGTRGAPGAQAAGVTRVRRTVEAIVRRTLFLFFRVSDDAPSPSTLLHIHGPFRVTFDSPMTASSESPSRALQTQLPELDSVLRVLIFFRKSTT